MNLIKFLESHNEADVCSDKFGGSEGEINHINDHEREVGLKSQDRTRYSDSDCERSTSASPNEKSFISKNRILTADRELPSTSLVRGSKRRGVDLLSDVLLCLLSSCYLNRSAITNQLLSISHGWMMLSPRNLVYLTLQTFRSHAATLSLPDHFSYEVIAM